MRILCLSCEALARMVYYHAATTPHMVDVEIIKLGLHATPEILRDHIQKRINAAEHGMVRYEAIALAYGLCGKATDGLVARSKPLVLARAHDCITLFLGSRAKYKHQFEDMPGTYWYALDYLQRNDDPGTTLSLGSAVSGNALSATYAEYVEKYGVDNADYLMTIMGAWQQHYQRAVYIDMGIGDGTVVEAKAREDAENRGWAFERMNGDNTLIKRLIYGEWDKDFLIVQPGKAIRMTYGEDIISAADPIEAENQV